MQFFIGKNFCFPENAKTATNSLCYSIVHNDYPELLEGLSDNDKDNPYLWRSLVPQTETPNKPVVMLFREPVDRFISAASMNHGLYDIEDIIKSLQAESGAWHEGHLFKRQSDYISRAKALNLDVAIFKFPHQIDDFLHMVGYDSIPKLNECNSLQKKLLTKSQVDFVNDYYAEDVAFFNQM